MALSRSNASSYSFKNKTIFIYVYTSKKKHSHTPKLYISNNPIPLKTAISCGELELILARLAEATPRGDVDDTELHELF